MKKINSTRKIHLVQELPNNDFDCRIEFCNLMIDRITRDPQFQNNITFSDEAFTVTGDKPTDNYRYWNNENLD